MLIAHTKKTLPNSASCDFTPRLYLALYIVLAFIAPSHGSDDMQYYVNYGIELDTKKRIAKVEINLGKHAEFIESIRLKIDTKYHTNFHGTGDIKEEKNTVMWKPDKTGGSLYFSVIIDHRRESGHYDALFNSDWAIFRGDDIIPPARVVMKGDTRSKSQLAFKLPKDWSIVTPYRQNKLGAYKIENPNRHFDRPTGWMLAGKIGVKRESIAGVNVTVAAPKGQQVRRMDILAHLNWNLAELIKVFPNFPKHLLIVSANDPMWRGALSGPSSLYMHADRPLISEDGTSPLIHEIIHVAMSARSAPESDWLIEGIAEYYSLEIMLRSKTITQSRYNRSLKTLADKGQKTTKLNVKHSHGAVTAKAVTVIHQLDKELQHKTKEKYSLDDVAIKLVSTPGKVTLERINTIIDELSPSKLDWSTDVEQLIQ